MLLARPRALVFTDNLCDVLRSWGRPARGSIIELVLLLQNYYLIVAERKTFDAQLIRDSLQRI